jgi:hypothetical protein
MRLVQLAAFVAATYAAIITAMYIAQTWLLFPTTLAGLRAFNSPHPHSALRSGHRIEKPWSAYEYLHQESRAGPCRRS